MFYGMTIAPMASPSEPLPPSMMNYRAHVGYLTLAMLKRQIDPSLKPDTPEWEEAIRKAARRAILNQCWTIQLYRRNRKKGDWLTPFDEQTAKNWIEATEPTKTDSQLTGGKKPLEVWGTIWAEGADGVEMYRLAIQKREVYGGTSYRQTAQTLLKQWAIHQAHKEYDEDPAACL